MPGTALASLLGDGLESVAPLRTVHGCSARVVAAVSGPERELAEASAGLPEGAARPEAIAARLRARGLQPTWGDVVEVETAADLLALCRERGRSSVDVMRADPSLLGRMQVGAWFDGTWRVRVLRRTAVKSGLGRAWAPSSSSARRLRARADVAFWSGVFESADRLEWRRLARSSYVALVYHRFAGEMKPGQERIDIDPQKFGRQLAALRIAGFRPLSAERLLAFHDGGREALPRRPIAITVDDGMRDCLEPLRRHADWQPHLFVPTHELGGTAHWMDGEPVAGWDDVRELAEAGVAIGSHAMHHRPLTELSAEEAQAEIGGSLSELRKRLHAPVPMLAFPNGAHDAALCAAARDAGYSAAFTTEKGRNGLASDPHSLRRVSVHGADGVMAILWKAATGEGLPGPWLRLRRLLGRG